MPHKVLCPTVACVVYGLSFGNQLIPAATILLRSHPTNYRRRVSQPRDAVENCREQVPRHSHLASWNVTYFECRVTFAPILISFSRSVVSDQCRTGFGKAKPASEMSVS